MRICLYLSAEDPPLSKYIEEKINMIKKDFLIKINETEEVRIREAKTIHEVDAICRQIMNNYWN